MTPRVTAVLVNYNAGPELRKALQSVALGLLDEHLAHCVVDAARAGGPEAQQKVQEASEAIARLVRS